MNAEMGKGTLRPYVLLSAIVLALRLLTALPLEQPGYMDASYTLHVGRNLASGRGFVQDIAWNYLDGPLPLPQPSNSYWLPLPAILAGASMTLFGDSYRAAQLPFILLSLVPPLLAFYLARRMYARDDYAWMAGLLTAFSGFYTIYWNSPDNFTVFAVTAGLALLFLASGVMSARTSWFLVAGIFVGLSQLARADALLLLLVAPILIWWNRAHTPRLPALKALAALGAGFLLVVTPWFIRNYFAFGSLLAPGSTRTLFLLNYDEFFSFDVGRLTLERYLNWGIGNIALAKLSALGFVLMVLVFGVWQIFLAPFAAIGFWKMRARVELQAAAIYLGLLVVAMAFVFTFPATHGSMLHSATALIAFGMAAVPPGLDAVIAWVGKRRKTWNVPQAQKFFRAGVVGLSVFLSLFLYAGGVWIPPGEGAGAPLWNARDMEYVEIDRALDGLGVADDVPIVTVDPPSFINQTGRRSIYLPTESVEAIFQAARQYGAEYLVLQYDKPATMVGLYAGKETIAGLEAVATTTDALGRPVTLFEITR